MDKEFNKFIIAGDGTYNTKIVFDLAELTEEEVQMFKDVLVFLDKRNLRCEFKEKVAIEDKRTEGIN